MISPWNFPVNLTFSPLAGILAAGNRAMIKPSEYTPATSNLMAEMFAKAFDVEEIAVIVGGPDVGQAFSELPFDHMIFTGATSIARHVMRAAAENLVPLTLELGGKSPAILGRSADYATSAARIMAGKTLNAGQICIAPDYVLAPADKLSEFVEEAKKSVTAMFPTIKDNPDYTAVIADRHYERIMGYVADAKAKGAEIVEINPANEDFSQQEHRKIPPTLILNPTDDMAVMQNEIFGPVLPVKTYGSIGEATGYVNGHDRPLALYYFGTDEGERERVVDGTTSGGVAVNDVIFHVAQEDLPFGGVGPSGMGSYHGVGRLQGIQPQEGDLSPDQERHRPDEGAASALWRRRAQISRLDDEGLAGSQASGAAALRRGARGFFTGAGFSVGASERRGAEACIRNAGMSEPKPTTFGPSSRGFAVLAWFVPPGSVLRRGLWARTIAVGGSRWGLLRGWSVILALWSIFPLRTVFSLRPIFPARPIIASGTLCPFRSVGGLLRRGLGNSVSGARRQRLHRRAFAVILDRARALLVPAATRFAIPVAALRLAPRGVALAGRLGFVPVQFDGDEFGFFLGEFDHLFVVLQVVGRDDHEGLAGAPGAAGAADAVDVVLRMVRHVVVEDMADGWDVEPPRGDVGRHQDLQLTLAERFQRLHAHGLIQIAVDRRGVQAMHLQATWRRCRPRSCGCRTPAR